VRKASTHKGPWPKLSVWHGTSDRTVNPANANEILKQWLDLHHLPSAPMSKGEVDGYPHQVWWNKDGETIVESYTITHMGHGTPIGLAADDERYGAEGPFLIEAGISSSYHIADFFGLTKRISLPEPVAVVETPKPVAKPADQDGASDRDRPCRMKADRPDGGHGHVDRCCFAAGQAPANKRFRVGGMVVKGSVARDAGDLKVRFVLTDFAHQIPVEYTGVLPDLFREGQGIIAHGSIGPGGAFVADEVLAKHDEKYMPPEVAASLKQKATAAAPAAGVPAKPAG